MLSSNQAQPLDIDNYATPLTSPFSNLNRTHYQLITIPFTQKVGLSPKKKCDLVNTVWSPEVIFHIIIITRHKIVSGINMAYNCQKWIITIFEEEALKRIFDIFAVKPIDGGVCFVLRRYFLLFSLWKSFSNIE